MVAGQATVAAVATVLATVAVKPQSTNYGDRCKAASTVISNLLLGPRRLLGKPLITASLAQN